MAPPHAAASEISPSTPADFPRFDVVAGEPTDHFFFKNVNTKAAAAANSSSSSAAAKKMMQEWRVLESNLPESIFVRVYESRISLLRAAIVGAAGTPYHDNLFFFDISLPSDYPSHPPLVHYRSFGFRINPNLYQSGRVCLSLLNTWSGHKSEKWDPNHSTLLQVLVSIQALVLNEKPYFNEPGYGGSRGKKLWEKKAVEYNQEVFVLSCKTALHLLRRPPGKFETFVPAHFRDHAVAILTACDAYQRGGGGLKMEKVYGELVEAFAREGAPVEDFVRRLAGEKEEKAKKREEEAKKKEEKRKRVRGAIRKKMMGVLDKIWMRTGLKGLGLMSVKDSK